MIPDDVFTLIFSWVVCGVESGHLFWHQDCLEAGVVRVRCFWYILWLFSSLQPLAPIALSLRYDLSFDVRPFILCIQAISEDGR